MFTPGDHVGDRYRLVGVLGEGGMGVVFAAEDTRTGEQVAVKVLRPESAGSEEAVLRFWQEALAASRIDHPNIIRVQAADYDRATGVPYIVEEVLAGANLRARLRDAPGRRLPAGEALALLAPIASALVAAHDQGIVHRDIKPGNIFLVASPSGVVVPKLIDFGISKLLASHHDPYVKTATGAPLGTPAYMSPEQARGDADVDGRSDVWSMGVVLFELLSGRWPYEAPNAHLLIARIIYERPAAIEALVPDVPSDVVAVVRRALEPDRSRRFASMRAFLEALQGCEAFHARSHGVPASRTPAAALLPATAVEATQVVAQPWAPWADGPTVIATVGTPMDWARHAPRPRRRVGLATALAALGLAAGAALGGGYLATRLVPVAAPATARAAMRPPPAPPARAAAAPAALAPEVRPPTAAPAPVEASAVAAPHPATPRPPRRRTVTRRAPASAPRPAPPATTTTPRGLLTPLGGYPQKP